MMKRLLLFLALAGTAFGQANIRYDNYTHAVQKPPTSAGATKDYDFTGLNVGGIATAPGGTDGEFQFNNAGILDGTVSLTISGGIITTNASKFVIYDNGGSSNNFKFNTTNLTGSRTVKIPDGNSTTVLPDSGAAHNFLNAIDINGNISKAQPTGSDIGSGGTINSTTFADTNTYRVKDGSNWRMGNASDSTKLLQWDLSNITTGTSRTATMPDGNATLVIADTGASNNFLNAISATGVITKARPTISNLTPLSGTSLLIGSNAGVSSVNEITLGSGISMSGSTLSATGSGGNVSNSGTPTSGQVAIWTDATHIRGSSTIDSPTFTTGINLTSAPLILSGNISSAAWGTGGLRIQGNPATFTDTSSSGTVTAAFTNVLGGNTIAASSATTFTDYVTLYARDPVAGSNVTLTNKWALGAESLRIGTSNQLKVSNSGVLTLAAAAVLGTPASGDFSTGSFTWPTFNQNTTGSAAKWTTARNLAGNSVDGSGNVAFANKFIAQGTADTGLSAAQFLGALGTGIVKNTTTTGVLSIATADSDYEAPHTTLAGYGITDAQAHDTDLDTWAGITPGTGVGTALAVNVGTAGAFVVNGGAAGTPSSETGTNLTGTGASFTAGNATKWTTGRTISTTGDVTYTSGSLDGSGNVTGTATLANIPAIAGTNLTGTADGFTAGDVTRNHAVYAAASPPTVDVGLFTIAKTGVNLKASATTSGFVVPTGRAFLCTSSWALVTSVTSGGAGTETWTIKESGASASMAGGTASGSATPVAGNVYWESTKEAGGPWTQCAAGNTVNIVVATSQAGSTAVTGTVFIQGFYTQ